MTVARGSLSTPPNLVATMGGTSCNGKRGKGREGGGLLLRRMEGRMEGVEKAGREFVSTPKWSNVSAMKQWLVGVNDMTSRSCLV